MDTDSVYSPGKDSASADSPMSLTSLGIPTRTHHLEPPPPNHGFPQHSRLSLALTVVPPPEGQPPPSPPHVQFAWEASGRDLQGLDEPMWVDEKDWDEQSKLSKGSMQRTPAGLHDPPSFSVWTQRPLMEALEEQALQTDMAVLPGRKAFDPLFNTWYEHVCAPVEPLPGREVVYGVMALQYYELCQKTRQDRELDVLLDKDLEDLAHAFMDRLYGVPYSHYWQAEANAVGAVRVLSQVEGTPLLIPPSDRNCELWKRALTAIEQAQGVDSLPPLEQKVLADIWHITLDHSCLDPTEGQAKMPAVTHWLESQDWERLQPQLSHLAHTVEPLLVLTETPQTAEHSATDEGETP